MQAKLIGVMNVNFTNNNGEAIQGKSIFVAFRDENVTGLRAEKFFVKPEISFPKDLKIDDIIEISFNHKGKIESISKA